MLDYDGTLAPFQDDPLEAYPYPGVAERLTALAGLHSVRLVVISGRPVCGVERFIPVAPGIEVWGDHGWEHRRSSGEYELTSLTRQELDALAEIRRRIEELGFPRVLELKPASLAVHWRALDPQSREKLRTAVESIGSNLRGMGRLRLIPFDGGLELRAPGRNKGTAVNSILNEETEGLPAAYLGDDLTDEDAFRALAGRGIGLLVRSEPRETVARYWMRPPVDLLAFLDGWISSASSGILTASADSEEKSFLEKP